MPTHSTHAMQIAQMTAMEWPTWAGLPDCLPSHGQTQSGMMYSRDKGQLQLHSNLWHWQYCIGGRG